MEIIFCKMNKIFVVILLVLLITMSVMPVVQAAEVEVNEEYKYKGTGLLIFKTESAAKIMNIFKSTNKWLAPGSTIKVLKRSGNAVKIGENQYININSINKNKFELLAKEIKVKEIKLDKQEVTIKISNEPEYEQLIATIEPNNATNKNIKWESTNTKVATVDQNGLVKGIKKGDAIIKAISSDGKIVSECSVVVKQRATGVTLNKTNATIKIGGENLKLTATVTPNDANNKEIIWESTDKSIATVKDGIVTPVGTKPGENQSELEIKATTKNGLATAVCKVKVKYIPVKSITMITEMDIIKNLESTKIINATIEPSDASNKEIKWKSNKTNVVTVENGTIKAVAPGTAKITASILTRDSKGKEITISKECEVTVKIAATGISLNKNNETIYIGDTFTLTPTIEPSNATNKNVIWSSNNNSVAKVTNGKVTGVGVGTANIIATTANGRYSVTCKVTVKDPYKYEYTVNKGKSNEKTFTYKIAVTKQKLDSVLKTIDQKDIYQNNGWYSWGSYSNKYVTNGKCYRIALCHLDMLRSDDVEKNIIHGYNTNKRESYSQYYQNISVENVKVNITQIKDYIDKQIPVSFHTYSQTGSEHWVAAIGYKGTSNNNDINDLLFISCTEGVLCINGEKDVRGQHSNKDIRILN